MTFKTATIIAQISLINKENDASIPATLLKLNKAMTHAEYVQTSQKRYKYVVAFTYYNENNFIPTDCTVFFGATKTGKIKDFKPLAASNFNTKNIEQCLKDCGYTIIKDNTNV